MFLHRLVQSPLKGGLVGNLGQFDGNILVKECHIGKRNDFLVGHDHHLAVPKRLINRAVQHDHLAVQSLKGPDSRVTERAKLSGRYRSAEISLRQGLQKRHLGNALPVRLRRIPVRCAESHTQRECAGKRSRNHFLLDTKYHFLIPVSF